MNWKNILVGVGIGIGAGIGISAILQKKCSSLYISPEKALSIAKEAFSKTGELTGSWIHMVPEQVENFHLPYEVYRGGVTVKQENGNERYEFFVEATSGTIIRVTEAEDKVTA